METTVSVSPPELGTDSPPPSSVVTHTPPPEVPMNINMSIAVDSSIIATVTQPTVGSNGGSSTGGATENSGVDLSGKKKRGRPRKYDCDGNLRVVKPLHQYLPSGCGGGVLSSPGSFPFPDSKEGGRGRPAGSGNWQFLAPSELFAGGDFTPHVVTVHAGEDVAGNIVSFAEKGKRGICILSANGAVSNVTIRQPGSSGGLLIYEGRFEILSLSGSFMVSGKGSVRSRTDGLSVSLASPDGRVIGGSVAGLLLAASPIQIVIGSFMPNGYMEVQKRRYNREHTVKSGPEPPNSQAIPDGEKNLVMESSESRPQSQSQLLVQQQQSYGDQSTENSENDIQLPKSTNSYVASSC